MKLFKTFLIVLALQLYSCTIPVEVTNPIPTEPKTISYDSYNFWITGELDTKSPYEFAKALDQAKLGNVYTFNLNICTYGGELCVANAIVSLMDEARSDGMVFIGKAYGMCLSAGTYLLANCDIRMASSKTRFMVHNPVKNPFARTSKEKELEIEHMLVEFHEALANASFLSASEWKEKLCNDEWFDTLEALNYGFIHCIIGENDSLFDEFE